MTSTATVAALPNLHPDDLLFFDEVRLAMKRVAREYDLPLRNITAAHMPAKGMADFLGKCSNTGDIYLVMRATVDGKFVEAPRSPDAVWHTAAHELAHLKHFNHGEAHLLFTKELEQALRNQKEDHRERILRKLVKMQAAAQGEAKIGNTAAAEAFGAALNKMMLDNELSASDVEYAKRSANDPVIEISVDLRKYGIDEVRSRVAWQENLARIVAKAHLCTFLVCKGRNSITFVGTKAHATVAEYVFGILVRSAEDMSIKERVRFNAELRAKGLGKSSPGFRESWLDAFVNRIGERLREAQKEAIANMMADMPSSSDTGLMRINGALAKVQNYIDDRFKGRRTSINALTSRYGGNSDGRERGRAAADAMPIGRRGINGGSGVRGQLK